MTKNLNKREKQILDSCYDTMKKVYETEAIFDIYTSSEILQFICGFLSKGIEKKEITLEEYYHIIDYYAYEELY